METWYHSPSIPRYYEKKARGNNVFHTAFPPAILVCFLSILVFISGCVAGKGRTVWVPAPNVDLGALLDNDWLGQAGERVWQLQARVTLGARKVLLDGMLRRVPEEGAFRLVLLAPMGLTLLDLELAATGMRVHEMAKDLQKAPQMPRHVARTLERVFLPPPVGASVTVFADEDSPNRRLMLEQVTTDGSRVLRVYQYGDKAGEPPRLVRLEAPKAGWTAIHDDYDGAEAAGPRRVEYRDSAGGYAVEVLLFPALEDTR